MTDAALPPSLRQSAVRVRFRRPLPEGRLVEFFRVRLGGLLGSGEDKYHEVRMTQPTRAMPDPCPNCGRRMKRLADELSRCERPGCKDPATGKPSIEVVIRDGPLRGVVNLAVRPEDRAGFETITLAAGFTLNAAGRPVPFRKRKLVRMARGVLLVLDRRYPDNTLRKVHAAAAELAEAIGLEVL